MYKSCIKTGNQIVLKTVNIVLMRRSFGTLNDSIAIYIGISSVGTVS